MRPRCKLCKQIIEGSEFTLTNGKKVVPNQNMTCRSIGLIYILECVSCKKFYIGSTQNALNLRINLHRDHTRHPERPASLGCNRHF